MAAASLLEAMATLGLQALVLASVLASSTAMAVLAGDAWKIHATLFAERQVEHLLDIAVARAGTGPTTPPAIAAATSDKVVLYADLDGNGVVDTTSSERTELEVRHPSTSTSSLLHRLGRQAMTVEDGLPAAAQITLVGKSGTATTAEYATGILVPRSGTLLSVAVPARLP